MCDRDGERGSKREGICLMMLRGGISISFSASFPYLSRFSHPVAAGFRSGGRSDLSSIARSHAYAVAAFLGAIVVGISAYQWNP